MAARGTEPPGARDEEQAARWVRGMFGRVAPRYDRLNTILSGSLDRWWRAKVVRAVQPALRRPEARVLDLCCGTGKLMQALERARGKPVWGGDFCHPMLRIARQQARGPLIELDALRLPLPDGSLDVITVAFGVRNFANYGHGFAELRRVLQPGGVLAILEFSQPPGRLLGALYQWYSRVVLPRVGGWISGAPDAYTYLPASVKRFPGPDELAADLRAAGFAEVSYELLTGGIVALHVARVQTALH